MAKKNGKQFLFHKELAKQLVTALGVLFTFQLTRLASKWGIKK